MSSVLERTADVASHVDDENYYLSDLMYGCVDHGEHKNVYTLHEDRETITVRCADCSDSWTEDK